MCTGSSARASGLRKFQLALYILDTRGNERRAVVRRPAARGRAPCRARRPGAAPRGPRPRPRSPASSSIIGVALVVGESLPAQKLVGLAIDLHRRRHALLDHRRFDEEVGVRSSPVPIGAERLLACQQRRRRLHSPELGSVAGAARLGWPLHQKVAAMAEVAPAGAKEVDQRPNTHDPFWDGQNDILKTYSFNYQALTEYKQKLHRSYCLGQHICFPPGYLCAALTYP